MITNSENFRTVRAHAVKRGLVDAKDPQRKHKRSAAITIVSAALLVALTAPAAATDVREIELRRLLQPTAAEQQDEAHGRVYIYDGLRDTDIEHAMDQEHARIENMMFIRTKLTDEQGEVRKDPETGAELIADDDC